MKRALVVFIFLFFWVAAHAGTTQTSKTLASTIITNARYMLNETSADFWSDTELLVWLNYGVLDIVTRTRCLEAKESISLVDTQLEYPLLADYLIITSVAYKTSVGGYEGLTKIEPSGIGENLMSLTLGSDAVPAEWFEWDGKISISPLPSANVIGDTVDIHFIDKPESVLSTENISLPAIYDRALILFIISKAQIKARHLSMASQLMAQYVNELDRYRMDFGEQQ